MPTMKRITAISPAILPAISLAIVLIIMLLFMTGCMSKVTDEVEHVPLSQTYFMFDTVVTVKLYDADANTAHFEAIEAILHAIDHRMNRNLKGSELAVVNEQAGQRPVVVSKETYQTVQSALDVAALSKGRFDPTIGPLVDLWGIGQEGAKVPTRADIKATLKTIDYTQVILDESSLSILLAMPNMSIDLGAIAKGFAADEIAAYLRSEQIDSAIIDLGGNILAMGAKPDGSPWIIGVQDPDQQRGEMVGRLSVMNKSVVTSGIYERYFIEDGEHYHHIFNPTNGYPVNNELLSVTIVTNRSIDADALSTTVYAMGLAEGLSFVESKKATEAMFITKDHQVYVTSGLQHQFDMTNDKYTLVEQ